MALWLSIGMPVFFCTMAFGILLSIGLHLASGPALTHMAVKGSFGALFQVKEWWQILRANLGGYLIVIFLIYAILYAGQLLIYVTLTTLVLMCITPLLFFAITPYTTVLTAVLFGQAYREGAATLTVVDEPAGDEPLPDPVI